MLKINWKHGPVGFIPAIIGMRNPLNSWNKSDSSIKNRYEELGPNDILLAEKLASKGSTHAKYRRMITVWVDITAPLYWWKEFDTYKVGTVANSCSTMHKIHEKEFELDDFSCEHLIDSFEYSTDEGEGTVSSDYLDTYCLLDAGEADGFESPYNAGEIMPIDILNLSIAMLNRARKLYLKTKDKKYWWQMIQLLPSSYNQKRTVCINYEVLSHIYADRRNHKLDEWHTFCDWIEELPHAKEMIFPKKPAEEKVDPNKVSIRKGAIEQLVWYLAGNNSPSDISEFLGIPDSRVKDMLSDSNREDAKDDDKIDWMQLSEAAIW